MGKKELNIVDVLNAISSIMSNVELAKEADINQIIIGHYKSGIQKMSKKREIHIIDSIRRIAMHKIKNAEEILKLTEKWKDLY
ncbi:MAG: hypothetical protein LBS69_07840 [Prevotellaceae bacterium]|jgi:hypothetical protein|nr:hypothetical protein [Prevotellaceae bacterium]